MKNDENIYPGPSCKEINVKSVDLLQNDSILQEISSPIKNGLVLELVHFVSNNKLPNRKVAYWLQTLTPICREPSLKTLESRISRTVETEKKFKKKKKRAIYTCLKEFQEATFLTLNKNNVSSLTSSSHSEPIETVTHDNPLIVIPNHKTPPNLKEQTQTTDKNEQEAEISTNLNSMKKSVTLDFQPSSQENSPNVNKRCVADVSKRDINELRYEMSKLQKLITILRNLVESERKALENLKSVSGHFSVRNVTKRDENVRSTRKNLRQLQIAFRKQRLEVESLRKENIELSTKLEENQSLNVHLTSDIEKLKNINEKKIKAQKQASHYRNLIKKVKCTSVEESFKFELKKKQDDIEYLHAENETLKEQLTKVHCTTKNENGSFSDNMRLCVMELFALEIGMEKIPCSIEIVGKHMFGYQLKKTDLPTLTTVRNIVDEGHYLAKSYIAAKVDSAENIGISRDGTTRRKEKILDTSVTLDNGEVMSLGFSKVARETAEAINNATKKHLTELAETVRENTGESTQTEVSNEFIVKSLEKLSCTMSDRASNEKAADKLLNAWRDEVLQQCDSESEKKTVFQFHCMVHVLLGFHSYVTADLKQREKEIISESGPIDREKLPMFKFWSKKQTVVERVAYTSSGVFGPAGDHNGLRDRWEAYCANKGVKSLIGNYKDNRFNSLFQTAAEVFVHYKDFLEVIRTVPIPNKKIVSVEADLQSDTVITMLRALTAVFIKVTGPYWWLVTSGNVSYLELFPYVQRLESFVANCVNKPDLIFTGDDWLQEEECSIPHLKTFEKKLATPVPDEQLLFLNDFISLVCGSIVRTIRKQLVDFLPGGRYSVAPSKEDLKRTEFGQVNNLACEHHFGDLDSSQRRRPNATFYHHSSVQLLKRNRKQLVMWINDMPDDKKKTIMRKARKGGATLRKRHREQDENVQREILEVMEKGQKSKSRKILQRDCDSGDEFDNNELEIRQNLQDMEYGFNENEYVVVAYHDAWYPGCVIK